MPESFFSLTNTVVANWRQLCLCVAFTSLGKSVFPSTIQTSGRHTDGMDSKGFTYKRQSPETFSCDRQRSFLRCTLGRLPDNESALHIQTNLNRECDETAFNKRGCLRLPEEVRLTVWDRRR